MAKFKRQLNKWASSRSNPLQGQADPIKDQPPLDLFCLNFKYFDATQGQSFSEWEEAGLLSKALERWRAYSSKKLRECLDKKFKSYSCFPSHTKEFKHPKHVPPDAQWASMHIQGEECIIGHIYQNVFYVVFLDRYHKFWPVDKKHT